MKKAAPKRWRVMATYRSKSATSTAHFEVEELEEIDEIIERGPDFDALVEIRVRYNLGTGRETTSNAQVQQVGK